jgi:hypothetical protein
MIDKPSSPFLETISASVNRSQDSSTVSYLPASVCWQNPRVVLIMTR